MDSCIRNVTRELAYGALPDLPDANRFLTSKMSAVGFHVDPAAAPGRALESTVVVEPIEARTISASI